MKRSISFIEVRNLFCALLCSTVLLTGCQENSTEKNSSSDINRELLPEPDAHLREEWEKNLPKAEDFLLLKDSVLQNQFFAQLDSIVQWQYPDSIAEGNRSFDISPLFLDLFLENLDSTILAEDHTFGQDYFFNYAPEGYRDTTICSDKIEVVFNESTRRFRLSVKSSFWEPEQAWCPEDMVVYILYIYKGEITDFDRQEAG